MLCYVFWSQAEYGIVCFIIIEIIYCQSHRFIRRIFIKLIDPFFLDCGPQDCGFWIQAYILVYLNLSLNIVIGILFKGLFI